MLEAVRVYVQGLASYRRLSTLMEQRLGRPLSRATLNTWVDQTGAVAMTPLEVSVALAPRWGGFLGVDGKAVFIKGVEHVLLVGVDQSTQDVVHAFVTSSETVDAFYRLVYEAVTVAGYPLKGLVMDASPAFVAAHRHYLTRVPLQLCRIHFARRLDHYLPKAKRSPDAQLRAEFKDRIRSVLFADSRHEATHRYHNLVKDTARYQHLDTRFDIVGTLRRNFGLYTNHHRIAGLPADSNVTENVIKQLGNKLRLMEGFATTESAQRFTSLLIGWYRFKRFTDSCDNNRNGKSPLELADVDHTNIDWLHYLLHHDNQQHST